MKDKLLKNNIGQLIEKCKEAKVSEVFGDVDDKTDPEVYFPALYASYASFQDLKFEEREKHSNALTAKKASYIARTYLIHKLLQVKPSEIAALTADKNPFEDVVNDYLVAF